jgi:hypothetical protein
MIQPSTTKTCATNHVIQSTEVTASGSTAVRSNAVSADRWNRTLRLFEEVLFF